MFINWIDSKQYYSNVFKKQTLKYYVVSAYSFANSLKNIK